MRRPTLPQLNRFAEETVPRLARAVSGVRMIRDVAAIQATDRWNSFDRFPETVATIQDRYREAGSPTQVDCLPTGGAVGSGHWIIHEAADVVGATLHVERPFRRKILDYRKSPWHITQWSAATPPAGLTGAVTVVDNEAGLDRLASQGLQGRWLLTRMDPRPLLARVAGLGALGIISDQPIANHPDAIAWSKFGWGGLPVPSAAARLVGLGLSANDGQRLRKLILTHAGLTLRGNVQVRRYIGHHDVVSAVIRGRQSPEKEIWYIAHYAEPGALDNASGVAAGIGIARAINHLIREGKLPQPRRSIRFVHGYETYGTLGFLKRFQGEKRPLAAVNLDIVGAKLKVCDGCLDWSATTAMTGGFVNSVGEACLIRALKEIHTGYQLRVRPFMGAGDASGADPMFGCPCPTLNNYRRRNDRGYDAYHSSADTVDLLSSRGIAACATAIAAYLFYLADADESQIAELARHETEAAMKRIERERGSWHAYYVRCQHQASISALARWSSDGNPRRRDWMRLGDFPPPNTRARSRRMPVPVRTTAFVAMHENIAAHIRRQIIESELPFSAMYWADGKRDLHQIRKLLICEQGKQVSLPHVTQFFEALAELGYVRMAR